jgi:hypothetical protein
MKKAHNMDAFLVCILEQDYMGSNPSLALIRWVALDTASL